MADPARDPHPDPDDMLDALQVPGEVVEKSNLADRRPDVNRLRAVRTGEGTATLYVGWPENSDTLALPARIYEQARAFTQTTKREDRLPEAPAVEVEVIVFAPGPELDEPSVAVLMDLSDLPLAQIEMHFVGLETNEETLDWFIGVVVAGARKRVEMGL